MDFRFTYLKQILETLHASFHLYLFRDMLKPGALSRSGCLLRHDVDIDLQNALVISRIEYEIGLRSTYMIIPDWPLYPLENPRNQDALREMLDMGHEIGLHFNINNHHRNKAGCNPKAVLDEIDADCERLTRTIRSPINSISFHIPSPVFIGGDITIMGKVNAYAKDLIKWYLSDSKGRWREGDPLLSLRTPKAPLLQLLIHPIWWGKQNLCPEDRLEEFFQAVTANMTPKEARKYDETLADAISVHRRNWGKPTE